MNNLFISIILKHHVCYIFNSKISWMISCLYAMILSYILSMRYKHLNRAFLLAVLNLKTQELYTEYCGESFWQLLNKKGSVRRTEWTIALQGCMVVGSCSHGEQQYWSTGFHLWRGANVHFLEFSCWAYIIVCIYLKRTSSVQTKHKTAIQVST